MLKMRTIRSHRIVRKIERLLRKARSNKTKFSYRFILLILLLLLFAVQFSLYFERNRVWINPFSVPPIILQRGYSGEVVSEKFIDRIDYILNQSKLTLNPPSGLKSKVITNIPKSIQEMHVSTYPTSIDKQWAKVDAKRDDLVIDIGWARIPLSKATKIISNIFTKKPHEINGSIVINNPETNQIVLSIRVLGYYTQVYEGTTDNSDKLIIEAAESTASQIFALAYAKYQYAIDNSENKSHALEAIDFIIRKDLPIKKPFSENMQQTAYLLWARILEDLNRFEEAIEKCETILFINPNNIHAYNNWSRILIKMGEFDSCIKLIKQALEKSTDASSVLYYNWGLALAEQKKHSEAILKFQTAYEMKKNYYLAAYAIGNSYKKLKRPNDAIIWYKKSLEISPYYEPSLLNIAVAYSDRGDNDEAIKRYRRILDMYPHTAKALNNWGVSLKKQNKLEDAIDKFKQAIKIDPEYVSPYSNISTIYLKQKKYKKAEEQARIDQRQFHFPINDN
jgi:tetratricopeptide (TPR) repeat protein